MLRVVRATVIALIWLTSSGPPGAQTLEVGGGISRACVGSEGSLCGDDVGRMWAAHGSAWIDDRLEIGLRVARMRLSDWKARVARDDRFNVVDDPAIRTLPFIDVSSTGQSRRIVSGDVVYHFARGSSLRGLLGVGIGGRTNTGVASCAPAGCERLMPVVYFPVGRYRSAGGNLTAIMGMSGLIADRVRLRGGIRLHNFGGESLSTSEVFVAAGYVFGRR